MKLKTSKSASKRVLKITSKGKIMRRQLSAQHLAVGKSKRAKKASKTDTTFSQADSKNIRKLVPYR